jgi:hypothetical protein
MPWYHGAATALAAIGFPEQGPHVERRGEHVQLTIRRLATSRGRSRSQPDAAVIRIGETASPAVIACAPQLDAGIEHPPDGRRQPRTD